MELVWIESSVTIASQEREKSPNEGKHALSSHLSAFTHTVPLLGMI